jgi:hypothetical protein
VQRARVWTTAMTCAYGRHVNIGGVFLDNVIPPPPYPTARRMHRDRSAESLNSQGSGATN